MSVTGGDEQLSVAVSEHQGPKPGDRGQEIREGMRLSLSCSFQTAQGSW